MEGWFTAVPTGTPAIELVYPPPEEDISSQLQNSGKVKVRLLYQEEQQTLSVTIEDVKGLVSALQIMVKFKCLSQLPYHPYRSLGRALKLPIPM